MGLTTCTLQSGKFTGLIYGEMEGPPFYTEDNSMPPEVRSCSSRARLTSQSLLCLERKEAGGPLHSPESPAPMSVSLSGNPHRCPHLPPHPSFHCSVTRYQPRHYPHCPCLHLQF